MASQGAEKLLPWTIAARVEHELIIKKSRFICQLVPVRSVAQADDEIAAIRKQYWDANHNCTALIVGINADQQRSSDDGEPSGTAGVPMLEVLRHRGVTDVLAVVTRYFGGVMLGAGGLVRAYGNSVSEALNLAQHVDRRRLTMVQMEVPHAEAGRVDNLLRDWATTHEAVVLPPSYGHKATLMLHVPPKEIASLQTAVAAATSGSVQVNCGETTVVDVPN
jgi:uncharacterized YigZ family protein